MVFSVDHDIMLVRIKLQNVSKTHVKRRLRPIIYGSVDNPPSFSRRKSLTISTDLRLRRCLRTLYCECIEKERREASAK